MHNREHVTRVRGQRWVLDRRGFLKLGAGVAGTALLAACGGTSPMGGAPTTSPSPASGASPAAANLKKGGVLKVAVIGEPPALADAMFTTATITSNIAQQMFEGLFARDSKYQAKPMLVDTYTVNPDGTSYTFTLRQGITFHSGKAMTSADVVSSLKRWGQLTGRGKQIFGRLDTITAPDPNTVTMTFTKPTGVLLDFLALAEAFILPSEIADAYPKDKLPEDKFIGTGPFKFTERQVDRFIRLTRFDGYQARADAADGAAGKKVAYVDEIQIIPVPDDSVRVNGLVTGEYHFSDSVPPDQYDTLKNDPNTGALIVKPYYWYSPHFNKAQGLFTDKRLRQAVQLAFSQGEALLAGFGRQDFVRFDQSIAAVETAWYSTAGQDIYNKPDIAKAKTLLQEAGYNGETVRWLATKEYTYNFNMADFIRQKLEAIGMKVELVVSDWATLVQNRAKPELYEIFLTGHSGYSHPATQPFNDKSWPGFWDNADKDKLVSDMIAEPDPAKQKQIIDQYQQLIWDEMPFVKCGDNFLVRGLRKEVLGYTNPPDWFFWNVGLNA